MDPRCRELRPLVGTEPDSGVRRLPEPDDARRPLLCSLEATRA
jgi:hypothetical protein